MLFYFFNIFYIETKGKKIIFFNIYFLLILFETKRHLNNCFVEPNPMITYGNLKI